jgi:enamine deaminase RidA (YjgF/YER057c/UK114 family)
LLASRKPLCNGWAAVTPCFRHLVNILSIKYNALTVITNREFGMHKTLLPEGWTRPKGYANGVIAQGDSMIFCGGQIGWNKDERFEHHDFIGQFRQALENVVAILGSAGAGPEHVTRMTWYVTDRQQYLADLSAVGRTYREVMGKHFPAMSVVEVSALIEDEALVEIEATAVK